MGIPISDELRTLRARAYGPAADIHSDPEAMRRLEELEDAARPVLVEETTDSTPTDDAPPEEDARATRSGPDAAPRADAEPTFWRRPRVRTAMWTTAVVVAALLGAGLTYSAVAITPVSASSGAPQIATVAPSMTSRVPPGYFGWEEGAPVFEYEGLTILQTAAGYLAGGDGDAVCIQVFETALLPDRRDANESDGWGYDGIAWGGCAVGAFPASAAVPLAGDAAPKADLPDGRAIQFVLEGDRLGVFLDRG